MTLPLSTLFEDGPGPPRIKRAPFVHRLPGPYPRASLSPCTVVPVTLSDETELQADFRAVGERVFRILQLVAAGRGQVGIAKEFKQDPTKFLILRVSIAVRKGCSAICDVLVEKTPRAITIAFGKGVRRPVDALRYPFMIVGFFLGCLCVRSVFELSIPSDPFVWFKLLLLYLVGGGIGVFLLQLPIMVLSWVQTKPQDEVRLETVWNSLSSAVATSYDSEQNV